MQTTTTGTVESREELIDLICEAAELEHMLICSYLFAAFSLKTSTDEGLTQEELDAVTRWKREILDVAVQEMLHLALANNMLTAIGSGPHFERPNFPHSPRCYPPEIQVSLAPLNEDTIQHFIFIERPEDDEEVVPDSDEYTDETREALAIPLAEEEADIDQDGIVPLRRDFETVGMLYRAISEGFVALDARLGRSLFLEPASAQATTRQLRFEGLRPVTNVDSALEAIGLIIEQGEGTHSAHETTHYHRFLRIQDEYRAFKRARPDFEPARPVLENPFARLPLDADDELHLLDDPTAVSVCDLFNSSYAIMVHLLMRAFAHIGETDEELRLLLDAAIDLMFGAIMPLGELLTTLPAGPKYPGRTAGGSFEMYRSTHVLPHKRAAWYILHERLTATATFADKLRTRGICADELAPVHEALTGLAQRIAAASA